ncbi:MAG: oligosaccharide flippase family protein, partial [Saprospiraceae bacterium]|nr:oligosaccharide flippase family protein [Saprospiraceae bacterium]
MSIKKLAGETAIYGISSIVSRLLYFLLTPYYTSLFLPDEYGIVTDLFAYIAFALVFFTYRMELAYFRFGSDKREEREAFNTGMWSLTGTTIVLGGIFIMLAPWMSGISGYADRVWLIYLALGVLVFDTLSEIPKASLRLSGRPVRFAIVQTSNIMVNLGSNLFFLWFCPWALETGYFEWFNPVINAVYFPEFGIGYIFLSNLIGSAVAFLLLLPEVRKMSWHFDKALWKKMLQYSLPLLVVGLSYVINETFDRKAMVWLLSGTVEENQTQLGIYGANYKLAMILALFTQAFRYGAEPFFFKQKNENNAKDVYAQVAYYFFLFGLLGFLGVSLFIDLFKYFLGDPAYWTGLDVVPILLMANLFLGMYYNFSVWYKLTDRTRYGAWISVGGALITIGLNLWWIPQYG